MVDTRLQLLALQMARNPMADSLVQSVLLLMARNPIIASLLQLVALRRPGTPWWPPCCSWGLCRWPETP